MLTKKDIDKISSYTSNDLDKCQQQFKECYTNYFNDQNESGNKCYMLFKQCNKSLQTDPFVDNTFVNTFVNTLKDSMNEPTL